MSAGCGAVDGEDDPLGEVFEDTVEGANEGHLYQGLAVEGRWALPSRTRRIGNEQRVTYDHAPPWNGGAGCAPGLTSGASMLRDRLIRYFPQISHIGGYVCREIRGLPNVMSQHGTGRALDVFIPPIGSRADNTKGDVIGNWLVENAQAIGVQSVIWDRTIWRVDRRPRDYYYGGVHPHHDHLHVEITEEAGRRNAPWYRRPFGPEACDPIPPARTVLSEKGACFFTRGAKDSWRVEREAGQGGSLLWTRAIEGSQASAWAQWSLPMKRRGEYRVDVYIDPDWGRFQSTRYQVRAGGLSYFPVVDQGRASGWTSLGRFLFEGGDGQFVRIFNAGGASLDGPRRIVADAIRVVPVATNGCEPLPPEGGVIRETSPCFHRDGPKRGWHTAAGAGQDGSLLFIKAKEGTRPKQSAIWRVRVAQPGRYEISAYVDPALARFDATRYKVFARGEIHPMRRDQTAADGWMSLGDFDLGGGTAQYVKVSDTSPHPVQGGRRRIVVDAIRVRPVPE